MLSLTQVELPLASFDTIDFDVCLAKLRHKAVSILRFLAALEQILSLAQI